MEMKTYQTMHVVGCLNLEFLTTILCVNYQPRTNGLNGCLTQQGCLSIIFMHKTPLSVSSPKLDGTEPWVMTLFTASIKFLYDSSFHDSLPNQGAMFAATIRNKVYTTCQHLFDRRLVPVLGGP